jgi:3',5'-cyclic AMP phosphodiesterase CpdA
VTIEGLMPHTRYRYEIEDLDTAARTVRVDGGEFRTAPLDQDAAVRIVAVGDTGRLPWWTRHFSGFGVTRLRPLLEPLGGLGPQWDIARGIERLRPDFFLHLGDVVYPRGRMDGYEDGLFRPFDRVLRSTPVFAVIGNHDVLTEDGAAFDQVFASAGSEEAGRTRYFTFAWGGVRIVVLDVVTAATDCQSPQARFLECTLANAPERWKLVAMHYPLLCSSTYSDNDGLIRDFWGQFTRHRVDLVLSGHSHDYQRFAPQDGVVQIIAGAGGHSIYPVHPDPRLVRSSEEYGFLVLKIQGRTLTGEAWTREGAQVDAFTLEK